ncbi:phosphoribosylanthranilate isomerase [Streptomyces subrutilus]|uniref:N-(5'-phosphoribosyl)anthranilate isomerase n=1 Tax=Streptomyces subrutilus TaxID=36818 RepID=A0A5P2URF1_9ACTN|nr:phosphoribosylanthranilate isomerase [Streptomyces subrutilus]QEU80074.1 phosphoribosylanthranilate isomerase [Streptomyces subrutilus]WSJ30660.1 phosphoribosylanthranilate isomerase [Streptomyces subrutilus]GGZ50704.1 N-(5'-phosphoribosyl)anthranilate isomerase [Streptomyces subrutilus]
MSETSAPFVKICGLKTPRDVAAAVLAGADAVGFVFAPGSPRTVDAAAARALAREVPPQVLTVGVFRGQPVEEVRRFAEESGVRGVQLHGEEGPGDFAALRAGGWTLLRATSRHARRCGEYGEDLLLIDAPDPGSGKPWNWGSAEFTAPRGRWLLAGGLTPGTVREALLATRAWGVDVSSGVESERGVKSPELIRAFVEAARAGDAVQ